MTGERVVHIVDDDPAIRRALMRLLRSAGLIPSVYDSGHAVLDATPTLSTGCMLLDVQMPVMNGIEAIRPIKSLAPSTAVLMLTLITIIAVPLSSRAFRLADAR